MSFLVRDEQFKDNLVHENGYPSTVAAVLPKKLEGICRVLLIIDLVVEIFGFLI